MNTQTVRSIRSSGVYELIGCEFNEATFREILLPSSVSGFTKLLVRVSL